MTREAEATVDDSRLAIARATVVALYSMAGFAVDFANAAPRWLPDLSPVPIEEVLRRIASLSPCATLAPFSTGRDIAIGAWDGAPMNEFKDELLDLMLRDIARQSPMYPPSAYEVIVRGEAEGDTAQITWAQYEQWTREFMLLGPTIQMNAEFSLSGEHPPRFIVRVSPPSTEGWITGTYL
jgi:hypothetical protein